MLQKLSSRGQIDDLPDELGVESATRRGVWSSTHGIAECLVHVESPLGDLRRTEIEGRLKLKELLELI
jgi:hypothetical protein